jgi:hypothetical protein
MQIFYDDLTPAPQKVQDTGGRDPAGATFSLDSTCLPVGEGWVKKCTFLLLFGMK